MTGRQEGRSGRREHGRERRENVLLPLLFVCLFAVILGRVWTLYYDLNDDSLMAQILSGSYTGTPESRNIQSYYPLTAVLAGLYRLAGSVDWYGIFLLICQFGSLALILFRLLSAASEKNGTDEGPAGEQAGEKNGCLWKKAGISLWILLAAAGLLLYHLVFLQYSMTVGMLGGAAAFWFLTLRQRESLGGWIRELLPPVLLMALGYLLRSEMMLFVGPFVAISFLLRLIRLKGKKLPLMLLVLGMVLLGLGAGELGNRLGCRSAEWKEFYRFFDARTQLYDFEKIPEYEGNEAFYDSIGLGKEGAELIRNYNFGLDDAIDADTLEKIAEYSHEKAAAEETAGARLRGAIWDYRRSLGANREEPYGTISLVLYAGAVLLGAAGFFRKEKDPARRREMRRQQGLLLGEIILLFALRSALFLYLYYHQRPVDRLTHSIYLEEAILLCWLMARAVRGHKKGKAAAFAIVTALMLWAAGCQIRKIDREQDRRAEANVPYEEFLSYCREHPDNVYLTDVYSTVNFSDPLFSVCGQPVNYDLMGGWASKSPLERAKLRKLGLLSENPAEAGNSEKSGDSEESDHPEEAGKSEESDHPEEAGKSEKSEESGALDGILLENGRVYVAAEEGASMDWLTAYYAAKGQKVSVREADRIGTDWIIYSVE